jgi:hypothetical protein
MKHLLKSLAAFQQEVPVIHKGSQGYGYSYADLPAIFEVINPLMEKHSLGFTQSVDGTKLTTTVFHTESGEQITAAADIPMNVDLKGMNAYQVLGSAITYMRRYQLSAMLGLVTDKDTDAASAPKPIAARVNTTAPAPKHAAPKVKATLTPEDEANWAKAIAALANGSTTIEKIKAHYTLSDHHEGMLTLASQIQE